jgi:cyclic pyranopterin phosphate synthase
MRTITDMYNRQFSTLRVSLLNRCNFSCVYCVDDTAPQQKTSCGSLPGMEEMKALILQLQRLLQLQVIRLTGGEPLLFKGIVELVQALKLDDAPVVKITTNGFRLPELAIPLAAAGVDEINVSLDAIDPALFEWMTGSKHLQRVIRGIDATLEAGIPVKLNAVIMKGVNEDQILPLLQFASDRKIKLRFLELMKMGHLHKEGNGSIFTAHEILERIAGTGALMPLPRTAGATARYWKTAAGQVFGIIANETIPFCADCNRLRLDNAGKIYGCLSNAEGFSIRGVDDEQLANLLSKALQQKQALRFAGSTTSMQAIGG